MFYNFGHKEIPKNIKDIRYYDKDYKLHDAEIVERNGNLILVRDKDTGKENYICSFELE